MDINSLLKGFNCSCGKHHTCAIEYVYVKDNGYLVAPLNNNNLKSFLPRFYTKEEFIKNAFNIHKAVRVSKNI